jgi:NADH:ubiquinone oxidoreductase subunit 5 (subunit L)/multisubunit Na+/H+ antiporter MnhA subunit
MPLTAVTALVASFSIAGVPLLNGFVSKWCIYVAAIQGSSSVKVLAVCAVVAILTSALTLASFAKFFGAAFLCRTSARVAERAEAGPLEVCPAMQAPQVALALFCVALGVAPALGLGFVRLALNASRQGFGIPLADANPISTGLASGVQALNGAALFVPVTLGATMGCMLLVAVALSRAGGSKRRADAPWLCGYAREAESNRYSAHNLYGEITRHFRWVGGAPHPNPSEPSGRTER